MTMQQRKFGILITTIIAAIVAVFLHAPIPQDPAYHHFADARTIFGIPNFWNVISNLPFVIVGLYGLIAYERLYSSAIRQAYGVFCVGAILVGLGSGFYHWSPSTFSLVWDRLPMTLMFMSLLTAMMMDRISVRLKVALLPLIISGVVAVAYWYWTELQGAGDLRAYVVVQFLPMLLIPLMLLLFTGGGIRTAWLCGMLLMYVLAKTCEHYDEQIYSLVRVISGHSIKHILAALAVLCAIFSMLRPETPRS